MTTKKCKIATKSHSDDKQMQNYHKETEINHKETERDEGRMERTTKTHKLTTSKQALTTRININSHKNCYREIQSDDKLRQNDH